VGYCPFSLRVIHKEGLCSSSEDINLLTAKMCPIRRRRVSPTIIDACWAHFHLSAKPTVAGKSLIGWWWYKIYNSRGLIIHSCLTFIFSANNDIYRYKRNGTIILSYYLDEWQYLSIQPISMRLIDNALSVLTSVLFPFNHLGTIYRVLGNVAVSPQMGTHPRIAYCQPFSVCSSFWMPPNNLTWLSFVYF
jgi:hypothetical protein